MTKELFASLTQCDREYFGARILTSMRSNEYHYKKDITDSKNKF